MTNDELKKHLKNLMKVHKDAKSGNMNDLIDTAITAGKDDFWGGYPWAFKEKHDTVTTTASEETVELPDDFDGLISAVHHENTTGRKLHGLSADEYDRMIPNSEGLASDTPGYYKIYYDKADSVWKLALYPTPSSAISLYLSYHTIEDDGDIPEKYIGGLMAGIAKYLFIPGSKEWIGANQAFLMEIERLKLADNVEVGPISRFHDSSDQPTEWDFEEYVRVRSG